MFSKVKFILIRKLTLGNLEIPLPYCYTIYYEKAVIPRNQSTLIGLIYNVSKNLSI